ncbi:MAG TPA: T9SS type A sorting domain-containing protein [Patescibacteria group bacterium]|nr:T9SS type A sorting domain-containing protein [Patescibacteria group bacterium]
MKTIMTCLCITMLVAAFTTDAGAWGAVTHAHLANVLGHRTDLPNAQEIYGSTLPDMFNLMYDSPYKDYLWTETHYGFMKVANRCGGRNLEAFAFGFVSHNDGWAADLTAHHDARTMPGVGYIIAKVNELVPALRPRLVDILVAAGAPGAEALADRLTPGLAENFVETAVDLLVRENEDPVIGYRLEIAAQLRDYRIPYRLFGAYAADFAHEFGISIIDAAVILVRAEKEYRDFMRMYGYIFTLEMSQSITMLSSWGAGLAAGLLKTETGMEIAVPPEMLEEFLYDDVLPLIEPDYGAEIAATLDYLAGVMDSHGFGAAAALLPAAGVDGGGGEAPGAASVRLHQNVPNPFNPATTIAYTLLEAAHVNLAVYDVRGREVAVLVDDYRPEGEHGVTWNAAGMPSGIYFCRLTAGGFTVTRKMCLLR